MIANYHQGFGRVDMRTTLPSAADDELQLAFSDSWAADQRSSGYVPVPQQDFFSNSKVGDPCAYA
jgi:hypothetical protein